MKALPGQESAQTSSSSSQALGTRRRRDSTRTRIGSRASLSLPRPCAVIAAVSGFWLLVNLGSVKSTYCIELQANFCKICFLKFLVQNHFFKLH